MLIERTTKGRIQRSFIIPESKSCPMIANEPPSTKNEGGSREKRIANPVTQEGEHPPCLLLFKCVPPKACVGNLIPNTGVLGGGT